MRFRLSPTLREAAWPLVAACVVFFFNLGGIALWDEDEPKNAVCAREMFERGDWIVPTFNGQLRTDKPILLYWLMLGSYHVFGVTEFAARAWSALLATFTVGLTCDMGRRLGPEGTGLWSGLALAGGLLFGVAARAATPDATFVFCTTLAFWAFVRFSSRPAAWWLIHASLAMAVLAKGPSGAVLPLGVMFLSLVFRGEPGASATGGAPRYLVVPQRLWHAGMAMRPLVGAAALCLIALPWYIAVGMQTGGAWPAGFLGYHNLQRYLTPLENHSGPIVYYIPAILIGMFPWSLWLPAAVWETLRRTVGVPASAGLDKPPAEAGTPAFLLCWAGVYLAVFSLAGTKLPTYVLPCYPALAILIGRQIAPLTQPSSLPVNLWPFRILAAMGVAIAIGSVVAARWSDAFLWLGPIGLFPLAGGILGELWGRRGQPQRAHASFAIATSLLMAALFGGAANVVDDYQTHANFARLIRESSGGSPPHVATLEAFRPTVVYYAGTTITDCPSPADAARFLEQHPEGYVIVRDDKWEALGPLLPDGCEILSRGKMFLRRHELMLIGVRPLRVASVRE